MPSENLRNLITLIQNQFDLDIESTCFSINLSRDLKLNLRRRDGSRFCIRIGGVEKIETEFRLLSYLNKVLVDYTVPVVGICKNDNLAALDTKYVKHDSFHDQIMPKNQMAEQVSDLILAMHGLRCEFSINELIEEKDLFLYSMKLYHGNALLRSYIERVIPRRISKLEPVKQHCDFTYTNLGLKTDGRVVVFDWEDYGRISIPGFDLSTFLLSMLFHGREIDVATQSPLAFERFLLEYFDKNFFEQLCGTLKNFITLFPYHLLAFVYLKTSLGYGQEISNRNITILGKILESDSWNSLMLEQGG